MRAGAKKTKAQWGQKKSGIASKIFSFDNFTRFLALSTLEVIELCETSCKILGTFKHFEYFQDLNLEIQIQLHIIFGPIVARHSKLCSQQETIHCCFIGQMQLLRGLI